MTALIIQSVFAKRVLSKCHIPVLQPSDKKLAESAHPNLIWAAVEEESERRSPEEDGHADAQTRGPANVLSMFLWPHDAALQRRCANIWARWTAKNARKRQRGRGRERLTRQRSGREREGRMKKVEKRWTDELKQRMRTIRGMEEGWIDGWTFVLSLVLWSSLCTYRLSQPSVATLCSLFSPSLKKRKYFCFLSFYCFII